MRPLFACVLSVLATLSFLSLVGCSPGGGVAASLDRADQYFAAGDFDKAEIEYLNVLKKDHRQPDALCGLGIIYHHQGRWITAAPLLIEGSKLAPTNTQARLCASMILLAAGSADEARTGAEAVLELEPDNLEAALLFADAVLKKAGPDDLAQVVESLVQEGLPSAVIDVAQAAVALKQSDLETAEAQARMAIKEAPALDAAYVVLGDILQARGDTNQALAAYQRSYDLADPFSPRKLKLAGYLMAQGDSQAAESLLKEMNNQNPMHVPTLLFLARISFDRGDFDAAQGWLEKVLQLEPRHAEALALHAKLQLAQGETDEGIRLLERLVKRSPRSPRLAYELAVAQLATGDLAGCTKSLKRVVELSSDPTQSQLLLAEVYLRRGDESSALVVLDQLLAKDGEMRPALSLLAEARRQQGKLDAAASLYEQLIETNPESLDARYRLAQVQLLQGNRADASKNLDAILEIEPGYLPALTLLADLEVRSENAAAALERASREVERNPDAPGPRFLLAQVHMSQGEFDQAVEQLNRVIELAPALQPAYLLLARIYSRQGRTDDARSQLNALLETQPGNPQALLMLGMLDESEGNYEAARQHYEKVLAAAPETIIALNNLAYLYTTHLKNLERAFELATQARKTAPRDPSVADTFGWVLLQRDEVARSLPFLEEAAAALPTNPTVLFHAGLSYYMNGLEAEARRAFQQALNLSADFDERAATEERMAVLDSDASTAAGLHTLEAALRENPADVVVLSRLGAAYQAAGQADKAQQIYETALRSSPNSTLVLIGLAELYAQQPDKRAEAMRLARKARDLDPVNPRVAHLLGRLAFHVGDHAWALSLLQESANQRQGDGAVDYDLAWALYSQGRINSAVQAMKRAIEADNPPADLEAARQFLQMVRAPTDPADRQEWLKSADSILNNEPGYVPAIMAQGLGREDAGDYRLAARSYERVLEIYPGFLPALQRLVVLNAEHLGNDAGAYELGMRARAALSQDPELTLVLGKVMYRRGDMNYALSLLRQAKGDYPENADLLYHLGLAECQTGDVEAGKRDLTRAVKLDPDHPLVERARTALAAD